MKVKIDELWIGSRCFLVEAEVEGDRWDRGDRSVGIPAGYEHCEVEGVTAAEYVDDTLVPVQDKTLLAMIAKGVQETVEEDDKAMEQLSETHDYEE